VSHPAFDLLSKFLVYPSLSRLAASAALQHPWFTSPSSSSPPADSPVSLSDSEEGQYVLLLPESYALEDALLSEGSHSEDLGRRLKTVIRQEWRGKSLGDRLHETLRRPQFVGAWLGPKNSS